VAFYLAVGILARKLKNRDIFEINGHTPTDGF
jgi:hypothetical protein